MQFNKLFFAAPILLTTVGWAQPAADATLSHSESSFLKDAVAGGIAEVKFGQLAEQNASSQQVKNFARRMVNEHSKMNEQLQSLASSKNVELPTDMGIKEKASYKLLSMKKGTDFDRAYMSDMVKDHEADISDFEKQADNGKDGDVRAVASRSLPRYATTSQQHSKSPAKSEPLPSNRRRNRDSKTQERQVPAVFPKGESCHGEAKESGTFSTLAAAQKHERAVQYFKRA